MRNHPIKAFAFFMIIAFVLALGYGCAENDVIDDATPTGGDLVIGPGCAGCHTDADTLQVLVEEPPPSSSTGEG